MKKQYMNSTVEANTIFTTNFILNILYPPCYATGTGCKLFTSIS